MHTIYNLNINLHKAALGEAENLVYAVSNFMVKTMASQTANLGFLVKKKSDDLSCNDSIISRDVIIFSLQGYPLEGRK